MNHERKQQLQKIANQAAESLLAGATRFDLGGFSDEECDYILHQFPQSAIQTLGGVSLDCSCAANEFAPNALIIGD